MDESYETFEEELGTSKPEFVPPKPVRLIRRPEMYASRKMKEESPPIVQQQPLQVPKSQPREPSPPAKPIPLLKSESIQNLVPIETPWESVTLNRCLFVAITILVLTTGFQRLQDTVRGRRAACLEEGFELTVQRSGSLRHRGPPPAPETSLWEVMFWWVPSFDDDDDDDDYEEEDDDDGDGIRRARLKRTTKERTSRGFRNRAHPDKTLLRQREGKLKDGRAKKRLHEEPTEKKERGKHNKMKAQEKEKVEEEESKGKKEENKKAGEEEEEHEEEEEEDDEDEEEEEDEEEDDDEDEDEEEEEEEDEEEDEEEEE